MYKKLLTVGALACSMFFAGNSFAQDEKQAAPVYPEYSFWSNWSLGFDVMGSYQVSPLKGAQTDWNVWNLGHRANVGWEILAEKELSPVWTYRFAVSMPGMFSDFATTKNRITGESRDIIFHIDNDGTSTQPHYQYDRFFTVMPMEFKLNLINWIDGYKPERRANLYALMGAGVALSASGAGALGFDGEFGLGYAHMLGANKCGQLFVEVVANDRADIPSLVTFYDDNGNPTRILNKISDFKFNNWNNITLEAKIGWLFYLGVTAADKEAIAQKSRLTEDYVKGLENQISSLEQDLAKSKQAEQRLQNRVNQLESENANLRQQLADANKNTNNGNAEDSEALKNIKENQTNLYGMPFSIQYAIDQYRVPAKEREKLEAVAQIMNSDKSVKYVITGFCDATGSDEYNQTLSEKRANTVKDELVNKYGVSADQLTVMGYGKAKPFGDAKYSINRRVSFYVNMD